MERRAAAFARLFEAVHEGVYIGAMGPNDSSTIAANPHLKLIFGFASETPEREIRPFDCERFVDPQARVALMERLSADGAVADYLLRLRRADGASDQRTSCSWTGSLKPFNIWPPRSSNTKTLPMHSSRTTFDTTI